MTIIEVICTETNSTYKYKYVPNVKGIKKLWVQSHGYSYLGCRKYMQRELSDLMGLDDDRLYRRYAIKHKITNFKY